MFLLEHSMLGNGGSGYSLTLSVEGSENAWHLDVRFRFDRLACFFFWPYASRQNLFCFLALASSRLQVRFREHWAT